MPLVLLWAPVLHTVKHSNFSVGDDGKPKDASNSDGNKSHAMNTIQQYFCHEPASGAIIITFLGNSST